MFGVLKYASGVQQLVEFTPISATDPGFGQPGGPVDPGWGVGEGARPGHDLPWAPARPGHGLPGSPGHPGNALPTPPVIPSSPIVLPPEIWPPALPPGVDNTLPPPDQGKPIVIPPNTDVGIEAPIYLPQLPHGTALLIALPPGATPRADAPADHLPAILVQSGKKPVLVYVSAAASPK
jgi:hypothetical protein